MLKNFLQVFRVPELRKKVFFVLGVFVVFRVMANIPIFAIDVAKLQGFFSQNQVFGLLNMFTGGAMDKMSIAMLGLGPYISSVIILQLLTMIFPKLEKMYKEGGPEGKRKFNQYGRLATIPLALLQGYGMLTLLQRQGVLQSLSPMQLGSALITIAAGTVFLMWLGELLTEKGIGNGISLLIFAGIISRAPANIRQLVLTWDPSNIPGYLAFLAMVVVIIAGVVLINEGKRNIPVSYAKRVRGRKVQGGTSTYLPMKVNPAGVIPIIFALSVLLFPRMIANFFKDNAGMIGEIPTGLSGALANPWIHGALYFLLVIMFTYFYTAVTFDPESIADNLKKMGGFIPGIRPGPSTVNFISHILNRVEFIGALFLGTIAVLPSIIQGITGVQVFQFLVGGTALLIVVSVVLQTTREIKAQLKMRDYETF